MPNAVATHASSLFIILLSGAFTTNTSKYTPEMRFKTPHLTFRSRMPIIQFAAALVRWQIVFYLSYEQFAHNNH